MNKNPEIKSDDVDLHGLPKNNPLLEFYDSSDSIERQTTEFPDLSTYVKTNDRTAGDMNPTGQLLLLHSRIQGKYVIEVLNTETLVSYVVFKQQLHKNTRIENLNWIDSNSFLYDLNFGNLSSTHVK